jgi:hypothetical protein
MEGTELADKPGLDVFAVGEQHRNDQMRVATCDWRWLLSHLISRVSLLAGLKKSPERRQGTTR